MSESGDRIRDAYDRWAAVYDSDENPTRDLNAEALRQQSSLKLAGQSVLEIGCGTGGNTVWLAEQAQRVVAVDFSEEMLARARRRAGSANVRFRKGDITQPWPFEAGTFDLVVANLVLEHVEDLSFLFRETHRVTTPEGQLYLSELHPYKQLQGAQARYEDAETGEEVHVSAFRHTTSEFVNGALEAGFALRRMDEWKGEQDTIPRLLTLLFERT